MYFIFSRFIYIHIIISRFIGASNISTNLMECVFVGANGEVGFQDRGVYLYPNSASLVLSIVPADPMTVAFLFGTVFRGRFSCVD